MKIYLNSTIPPTVSYAASALAMCIFLQNEKNDAWFYSNYINVFSAKDCKKFNARYNFVGGDIHGGTAPLKYEYYYDLAWKEDHIIDEIFVVLSQQKYIFTYLDWFYLGCPDHIIHNILISGVDFDSQTISLVGYDLSQNYKEFKEFCVPFDKFIASFFSSKNVKKINFISNKTEQYMLSEYSIKTQLGDYIASRFTIEKLDAYFFDDKVVDKRGETFTEFIYRTRNNNEYYYGLDCYQSFSEYVDLYKSEGIFDIRPFRALMEHKMLLMQRLKFFCDSGKWNSVDWQKYMKIAEHMIELAKNQFFLCLKENSLKDFTSINRALQCIEELKQFDEDFSNMLYQELF